MENSTFFATFLKINRLTNAEISRYLEKSAQYIGQCVKGTSKLSWDSIQKLRNNPYDWDCSMLPDAQIIQTIGNHSPYASNNCNQTEFIENLRSQISNLQEIIKNKDTQIDRLLKLLENK